MAHATYSAENQFSFICPIFNTETKIRACLTLRDLTYRGEKPEVRKGCQACVSASKCPVAEIVRSNTFGGGSPDSEYFSAQVVVGKLRSDVLEKMLPVLVPDSMMTAYRISAIERELMASAHERIAKQLETAPGKKSGSKFVASKAAPPIPRAKTTAPTPSAIQSAAATGDLSAAISGAAA